MFWCCQLFSNKYATTFVKPAIFGSACLDHIFQSVKLVKMNCLFHGICCCQNCPRLISFLANAVFCEAVLKLLIFFTLLCLCFMQVNITNYLSCKKKNPHFFFVSYAGKVNARQCKQNVNIIDTHVVMKCENVWLLILIYMKIL